MRRIGEKGLYHVPDLKMYCCLGCILVGKKEVGPVIWDMDEE